MGESRVAGPNGGLATGDTECATGPQTDPLSALGTMVATGAIAYGKLSGGEKPTGPVRPAPIEKDQTITATSKAEEDL